MRIKLALFSAFAFCFLGLGSVYAQSKYTGLDIVQYRNLLRTGHCPYCKLYFAKLGGVDLTGANLRGAVLIGASFRRSTLRNANLRGATLSGTSFAGADLSGAIWVDGKKCEEGSIGYCKQSSSE